MTWLNTVNYGWDQLIDTRLFHKTCVESWSKELDTTALQELIQDPDKHAYDTHGVVQSYLKKWLNKNVEFKSRRSNSNVTARYGAVMLDSLIMTWILNGSAAYEMNNLKEKFNLTFLNPEDPMGGVMYSSKVFGNVYIGDEIIFIESCNMI